MMAVKLRLQRFGAKKKPIYRLVAADSRVKRDGKYLEIIGQYNPLTQPATVKIDEEKARKWLDEGAQMTDTVKNLFSEAGITSRKSNK
jgi:small subunit ribosomal protein S16